MLSEGKDVFVQLAEQGGARVLHPANVASAGEGVVRVRFAELAGPAPAPGLGSSIYFQGRREFMQQPCEVAGTSADRLGPLLELRPIGEPASAESRRCFRVCTVMADYHAEFGALGRRKLVDVSATGVGFVAEQRLSIGDIVEVKFTHSARSYAGVGFVQSHKEVRQGNRYGLLCTEDGSAGLARGLQMLSMAAQRAQLKRLAGAV